MSRTISISGTIHTMADDDGYRAEYDRIFGNRDDDDMEEDDEYERE